MHLRQFVRTPFIFVFLFCFKTIAQEANNDKHIHVSLRMVGHQILLTSGDSTSRVLPISREKDQYIVQFESNFKFNPDELVQTVNQIFKDTKLAEGYFMEVLQCETGAVVYSYEKASLDEEDIIPCQSRDVPKACYSLLFTLKGQTAVNEGSAQVPSGKLRGENLSEITLVLLILIIVGVYFVRRRSKKKVITNPNLISIGKYSFDTRKSELILKEQRIELSSKESELLFLLYNAVNTTVEREVLLNVVWGDEGDYVGRTLDVFISKLRKKLEADPNVKIANIRGVGYKLVL